MSASCKCPIVRAKFPHGYCEGSGFRYYSRTLNLEGWCRPGVQSPNEAIEEVSGEHSAESLVVEMPSTS